MAAARPASSSSAASIFGGYLNYDGRSPFVSFEGKSWYHTGDLVSEDADGVLTFAGRLKRFIKLGGEMISLPAIESVLQRHFGDSDDGPFSPSRPSAPTSIPKSCSLRRAPRTGHG